MIKIIAERNYHFACEEIRGALEAGKDVWVKLNQLRQYLTLTKDYDNLLVDFCHYLLGE